MFSFAVLHPKLSQIELRALFTECHETKMLSLKFLLFVIGFTCKSYDILKSL